MVPVKLEDLSSILRSHRKELAPTSGSLTCTCIDAYTKWNVIFKNESPTPLLSSHPNNYLIALQIFRKDFSLLIPGAPLNIGRHVQKSHAIF